MAKKMTEPKTVDINAVRGNLRVTLRTIKNQKTGEIEDYLSFGNGTDITGVYLGVETRENLIKFLGGKK